MVEHPDRLDSWWTVVGVVSALAVYNVVRSASVPGGAHLVTNVAIAALVLSVGLAAGLSASELGVASGRAGDGVRLGAIALLVVAVGLVAASLVPAARGFFDDDRVDVSLPAMLLRIGVVIPIGTVLVEEIIFRGVLHGLLRRRLNLVPAAIAGATLFGLWHLFPVWRGADGDELARAALVGGTFAVTFVAGLVFVWLRDRSGSLIAPILAHVATNSLPFALAWVLADDLDGRIVL